MLTVELYTRHHCGLCDEAHDELRQIAARHPFHLKVVDIDDSPDLSARYGNDVPVIMVEQTEISRHKLDGEALLRHLQHRQQLRGAGGARSESSGRR